MKRNKILMVVAMAVALVSCGGKGGGMPNFGDNEFPVQSAQTKVSQ
jgi:membrane fusion protein (multidrug efflux system)